MVRFAVFLLVGMLFFVDGAHVWATKSDRSDSTASTRESDATNQESDAAKPSRDTRQSLEQSLLKQAEAAFRAGRFLSPVHDNAYDRFHSVLLINPDNATARAGLQAILLKYSQLVRIALDEGRLSTARNQLRTVELYFPGNELLLDLKKKIRAQTRTVETATNQDKTTPFVEEISLPGNQLKQQSQAIKDMLAGIAGRLRDTDESVLIYARSDREGRWIYSQLKAAATGYRVRGDIRISRAPKIRIMPPL